MRPDRNTLQVESTLQGEDVRMGIAAGAEAHIMSVLTDLYEDPEMAAIREYATNAWDSHIEAGVDRPIEVTTPSALRPLLTIRDYGIGLDAEGVRRIYSQYGASTKRGTDEQVGMLGVGCKSALTYTDQFTIVAVKDGRKITVSVSRDEDGAGTMKIVSDAPTDELNGVEVQVPVKRENEFAEKAAKFFRFWEPGQVLLNGSEPAGLGGYALTDSITILDEYEGSDYIVMGGVPYPAELELYGRSQRAYGYRSGRTYSKTVVAKVGIGAVTFTPSREGLQDTERTRKCIADIKREFTAAAKLAVQRDVDAAGNKAEALAAYVTAVASLPPITAPTPHSITFQGAALPAIGPIRQSRSINTSGYANSEATYEPELSAITQGVWITDYDNGSWAKGQREKLLLYLQHEKATITDPGRRPLFRVSDADPPEKDWIPADHIIPWPVVRKWQPPRQPGQAAPAQRITGTYYALTEQQRFVRDVKATDLSGRLYWFEARKYSERGRRVREELRDALPGGTKFTLLLLPANRVEKFKRDFPKARSAQDELAKLAKKRQEQLTPLDLQAMAFSLGEYDLEDLDAAKVDDPNLAHMIEVAKRAEKRRVELTLARKDAQRYSLPAIKAVTPPQQRIVRDRYPLLAHLGYGRRTDTTLNHIYIYTNAVYAKEK